ncbi:MAG: hypothetical protein LBD37_02965 [Treponema sp.]|nr:hypothetical protein [Treponema sp.]
MAKGTVFLLARHSDWGKSQTLKALTGGNHHPRRISITGTKSGVTREFFIKRSSNGDDVEKYWDFAKKETHDWLIAAFSSDADAAHILEYLAERYTIYCFVLEHCYSHPEEAIPQDELAAMQKYAARVSVYSPRKAAADTRAAAFCAFIEAET